MPETITILCARVVFDSAKAIRVITNGFAAQTLAFTVTALTEYYVQGDFTASDLCLALQTCLNLNTHAGVFTVTKSATTGRITINCTLPYQILWDDAATTVDKALFGFTGTQPAPAATTSTGSTTPKSTWFPDQPYTDTNWGDPDFVGWSETTISGKTLTADLSNDTSDHWDMNWNLIDQSKIKSKWGAADPTNTMEYFWRTYLKTGCTFRIVEDVNVPTVYTAVRLVANREIPWIREQTRLGTSYSVRLRAREVT